MGGYTLKVTLNQMSNYAIKSGQWISSSRATTPWLRNRNHSLLKEEALWLLRHLRYRVGNFSANCLAENSKNRFHNAASTSNAWCLNIIWLPVLRNRNFDSTARPNRACDNSQVLPIRMSYHSSESLWSFSRNRLIQCVQLLPSWHR